MAAKHIDMGEEEYWSSWPRPEWDGRIVEGELPDVYKNLFKFADANGSGTITRSELYYFYVENNISDEPMDGCSCKATSYGESVGEAEMCAW